VLVWELDTPALVVDLDIMEQNLRRAAEYAAAHGLRLRPHTKTHKSPELARRQLALGAAGLTVAKVGEAEVMLGAGPADLLLAYPVIGAAKLRRLVGVARSARVTVALDSLTTATALSALRRAGNCETWFAAWQLCRGWNYRESRFIRDISGAWMGLA
jgi:D-serine deaminase-like pyridoxal phosphate-dependent protein